MIIYGTALLAACSLAGLFIGETLGHWLGVKANVGGVGFSMLLLMATTRWLKAETPSGANSAAGIYFWSAMYVPIVVAMAANQDVAGALHGGPVALLAGSLAVALSFLLIPVLCRMGSPDAGCDNSAGEEQRP